MTLDHDEPGPAMHLAQVNIARARFDFNAPEMADFMRGVDLVNGVADRSPGLVWRLDDPSGGMNQGPHPRDIVNLSVWTDAKALSDFLRNTVHRHFVQHKHNWFLPPDKAHVVMWSVNPGTRPTLAEGLARLAALRVSRADQGVHVLQGSDQTRE
ncbi:DUF3291 domain-containing protein [Puniceibacterium sediminis]|uniref:DUF3291 domain-containing protein n=1 Tax=Puniceibacterium sediminis TaxID=1608407 RepID=A0A238Z2P2_9RHOB|nr:DUF3291 domain-containing protein [Puniceibacterium sediminis]SNR77657.1 protein of unknown function [Puniceibacterium sediminis]